MPIIIIFSAAAVLIVFCLIYGYVKSKKENQIFDQRLTNYFFDFSVSEYMGRMEAASIEIAKETEKEPKYQLVLWAGLDGLRLNDDGTSEWIRRGEEKPKRQNVSPCSYPEAVFPAQCMIENSIPYLQRQINAMQMQNAITQQNQYIINAFHPLYPQYIQQQVYYGQMAQCCCDRLY